MSYEKSLNEECGIFGIYDVPNASNLTYFGLHALQHRGQQGAGIVANDGIKLRQFRNRGLLADVFADSNDLKWLKGNMAIGHVRYGTSGSDSLANVQPFLFHFLDGDIALAHNGNLTNALTLKKQLENKGAVFQSSSDTEVLIHLIRQKRLPFVEALKKSLNEVKGGFAFLLMTNDAIYAAVDSHGFRPLTLGKINSGSYVLASESCALDAIGATLIRDVKPGELITIDKSGLHSQFFTKKSQLAICSMEYIYFARPDSIMHGVTIHNARKRMGRLLAQEQPAPVDADMVIGVPNSSLSAASGFAEESGLSYEMGLIKNQYIARTFIEPTQQLRESGVRMKLSPVRGVVEGRNVVIVDDSIVRGTTSMQLVKMLKDAGARTVHMRIASPPFKYPHFYGIDISHRQDLLAAKYNIAEMTQLIGADSLGFLSIMGLIKAIDIPAYRDAPNGGLTVAYFDGKYPEPLYDYEDEINKPLQITPVTEILEKRHYDKQI